jgi:hypothetical protein
MLRNNSTQTGQTRQTTRQTTGQTGQNESEDYRQHQENLTKLFASRRPRIADASPKQIEEARQSMYERTEELHQIRVKKEQAELLKRWEERDRREQEKKERKQERRAARSFVEQMAHSTIKKVPRLFGYDGGSKSKEILGKQRRIYKVAGSRKEHIKYKGQLIPVSDYKKLMKPKH